MQTKLGLYFRRYKSQLAALVLGGILSLSLAHHFLNFWERPAMVMLGLFTVLLIFFAWLSQLLLPRFSVPVQQLPAKRLGLFIFVSLLIGSFAVWRTYRAPVDYQTLVITPMLGAGQEAALVEVKADGRLVPIKEAAAGSKWDESGGKLYATNVSEPLTIHFKRAANAPVSVLLETSPQGGRVKLSFEHQTAELDLRGDKPGDVSIAFSTRYRGVPNELFIPALILADILTFSLLVLAALVLQEMGQAALKPANHQSPWKLSHHTGIILLTVTGLLLHLLNALAVPLILDADSPGYLEGALHWLRFGDLSGVPVIRGPGTTFLFAPILLVFGRNPWGMKVLLHLVALACIPLSYWLGWQVSKTRLVAFLAGGVALFTPDMYLYSNFVMSDLINLFLVLAFCTLLFSAMERPRLWTILCAMLAAAFSALIRSESLLLLVLALLFLLGPAAYAWLMSGGKSNSTEFGALRRQLSVTGLAFGLAVAPLIGWSIYNYRLHGFFSVGNHTGIVLYDGWVYYGDASKLSFSDPGSGAVRTIRAAIRQYPTVITDKTGSPTSLEVYPSLAKEGYSEPQAFGILQKAALDSIRRDPSLTMKLLFIKLRVALQPEYSYMMTYALPGEPVWTSAIKQEYFNAENVSIPGLIRAQRSINEAVNLWYPRLYPAWVLFCVFTMGLGLFRTPARLWIAFVLITATRIFIPAVMGLSVWRYTLAGWLPLQIISLSWIWLAWQGLAATCQPKTSQAAGTIRPN